MNHIQDSHLYDRHYFSEHYLHNPLREAMYQQEYERIVARWPRGGGYVLDVGCGVGKFLAKFPDANWITYGVEPSSYAAQQAIDRGVNVHPFLKCIEDCSMHVVVFRGTLQHINTPMEALAEAVRILKPGGLLVILATPDTESMVYQIWKTLPALDAPRNWILFGGHFLMNILRRLNFRDIEILHPYWGTPYANPLVDGMRFLLSLVFGYRKFAWPGNMMEIYAIKAHPYPPALSPNGNEQVRHSEKGS